MTDHRVYDMDIARAMGRGANGWSPYDHEVIVREIELGERATRVQEWEELGFGALFDLSFDEYMRAAEVDDSGPIS